MRTFEHEMVSYKIRGSKDENRMRQELREWGAAGFEIVAVLPGWAGGEDLRVFLKREIETVPDAKGEAA